MGMHSVFVWACIALNSHTRISATVNDKSVEAFKTLLFGRTERQASRISFSLPRPSRVDDSRSRNTGNFLHRSLPSGLERLGQLQFEGSAHRIARSSLFCVGNVKIRGRLLQALSVVSGAAFFLPQVARRCVIKLISVGRYLHAYPIIKLSGYRSFTPDPNFVLVTCCTNGMGHVHQMERVLGVLQDAGLSFPVIGLANAKKVPKYKMESLKKRFPNTEFIDLKFEIDYDGGSSFNNLYIALNAFKTIFLRASPFYRRTARMMQKYRPAACLSFWEPGVATFINVMNAPTRLVSVASQGQIYADDSGYEKSIFLQGLELFSVGRKGTLVPLSVKPLEGAIPQVVRIPKQKPTKRPAYFVAYSTVPVVLDAINTDFAGQHVRLFVKEREYEEYVHKYRNNPFVDVRVTSPDFPEQLAQSRGLIASPSRGVVTQAIALGKPVYLFCPRGHLEQEYNLGFYMRRFRGVSCPNNRRYRRYLGAERSRDGNVTLPSGYNGRMQTLTEWEASINDLDLTTQAKELRDWLSSTDKTIRDTLIPLLTPDERESTSADRGGELSPVVPEAVNANLKEGRSRSPLRTDAHIESSYRIPLER